MKLATLDDDGYVLVDGESQNKKTPDSFHIPSFNERNNLKVGMLAKCSFRIATEGITRVERMWVEVVEIYKYHYIGKLQNIPLNHENLNFGDKVFFEPKHIIDIREDSDENPGEDNFLEGLN